MHLSISPTESNLITASIINEVKMVIWDLDDTFWKGTLSESGIEFNHGNAAIVRTLAARGIISSIVSKNDFDAVREILEREGVWEYFIFPSIAFEPKGNRVSDVIKRSALRPENVLFVDDNFNNLEEVRYFNKGIMLASPELIVEILDHPRLRGKPDPELNRLKQYQLIQRKSVDYQSKQLSNEEFLRSSAISISFGFDVDAQFDRIIDLVNRANQLNFTKKRLETKDEIEAFRLSLNEYGVSTAYISCQDKYGDYGVVGFYLLKKNRKRFELVHFVFSCRTMNMGIEQFVYEYLNQPEITVVPDVAYSLNSQKVDWIAVKQNADQQNTLIDNSNKLLLVGGCDLLQLASFCSRNRVEIVNKTEMRHGDEYIIRYDDPSFFIADRTVLRTSEEIKQLSGWSYDDAVVLDQCLKDSSIVILSMREGLNHIYIRTNKDIFVRVPTRNIDLYLKKRSDWFNENFTIENLTTKDRLDLIERALQLAKDKSLEGAAVFILGATTRNEPSSRELVLSKLYNQFCLRFCQQNPNKCYFVDLDEVVHSRHLFDNRHFSRDGYHALSNYIMKTMSDRM